MVASTFDFSFVFLVLCYCAHFKIISENSCVFFQPPSVVEAVGDLSLKNILVFALPSPCPPLMSDKMFLCQFPPSYAKFWRDRAMVRMRQVDMSCGGGLGVVRQECSPSL